MANTTTISHLLLFFDDLNLGQVIADYLENLQFRTRLVDTIAADGLRRELEGRMYEGVIVFRSGDQSTIDVVKRLREITNIPIFAALSSNDKVMWQSLFRAGADDLLFLPLSAELIALKMSALVARIREAGKLPTQFRIGSLTFDADMQHITTADGTTIRLSGKENDLLQLLAAADGGLVERGYILRKIWREETYFNSRSLSVYVNHLRHILEVEPRVRIFSIHGRGYKLTLDDSLEENNIDL